MNQIKYSPFTHEDLFFIKSKDVQNKTQKSRYVFEKMKEEKKNPELEMGIKVEMEHVGTMDKIEKYLRKNNKMPSKQTIAEWIASDHLEEMPDYYTKLKAMEKKK